LEGPWELSGVSFGEFFIVFLEAILSMPREFNPDVMVNVESDR
jgi:hypothetical protein